MVVSASVESEDYGKRNSADNTGEQEIICKKKSQDGSTHSVTIEDLKRCLLQVDKLTEHFYLTLKVKTNFLLLIAVV